jgi:acyl-CoA synthetase (AMP-forming)/AMP-acid ligase II
MAMGIELLLDMAVSGHGDRVALGRLADGMTFERLQRTAAGVAALLLQQGATHLAMVGVTGPLLPIALFAGAIADVPVVPLNYRLTTAVLDELLSTFDRPLVVADKEFADQLRRTERLLIETDDLLTTAEAVPAADPRYASDDGLAVILFTSGTTSRPKGVLLSHANLTSYVLGTVEFGSASADDAQLIAVPPYHIAGVGSALTATYAGRRVVHMAQFSPESWLRTLRDERITTAMVVPTMLARVTEYLDGSVADTPALRSLAYGGARMPRPVLERALASFPDVGFTNAYGLTETSSTITVLGPEHHRQALASVDPEVRARLGSVGQAVPGIELAIRAEDGTLLPARCPGEVLVRGPQVSGRYAGLGSVLIDGGWFPTKDRGFLDADGFLYLEGRSDDTIIRGGENIAPAEIEDVLARHPSVRECAVVGVPDEEWGERLGAVVVEPGHALSANDVREFARAHLRGSRTPDEVRFIAEMPYTATGKLLRRELVETFDQL